MQNMRVSIIMPTYNSERWVERAILSVLAQSYKNYELVIVDDGSTDNTYKLISKYTEDPRIKIFRLNVNSGVSNARNIGIELCKGDIVTFLDSDDEFLPNALETIVQKFKSLPDDVGIIYARTIDDNGKIGGCIHNDERYITIEDVLCKDSIKGESFIAIKHKFIQDGIRFYGKFFHHLSSFYFKIMKSTKAYAIPNVLVKYHNLANPESLTKVKRNVYLRISSSRQIAEEISYFLREFGEILKRKCRRKYSSINLQLGMYALLSKNRKLALKALIKSLCSYPLKPTIIWVTLLFFPAEIVRQLYLRLYAQ